MVQGGKSVLANNALHEQVAGFGMGRCVTAAVLTVAFSLVWFCSWSATTAAAEQFADVRGDEWFVPALAELASQGVVQGFPDQSFGPHRFVTKGQLALVVLQALGLSRGQADPAFVLLGAGIMDPADVADFKPWQLVSREEAASYLVRAVKYACEYLGTGCTTGEKSWGSKDGTFLGEEGEPEWNLEAWLGAFSDRNMIKEEKRASVAEAFRLGIFQGAEDGYFYPAFPLSRAEMVVILHRAFVSPPAPLSCPPEPRPAVTAYPPLKVGSTGRMALVLERRLSELGYVCGDIDGVYDKRTRDAVIAFEKFEKLARDGIAEPNVWECLFFSAQTPTPRLALPGKRVEVDLSRQTMLLIFDGHVTEVIHVSTGKAGTPTGYGKIWLKQQGWVECSVGWMYYPCYFWPRIAIHGSSSVPPYPASHGCIRTPVWIAPHVFSWLDMGTRVDVYY